MYAITTNTAILAFAKPSTKTRLSVRICSQWDELEQLVPDWNSLLQANHAASIFQTPEWLSTWWRAFASNRRLRAVVFLDESKNTVGILPLYTETRRFLALDCKTLRMVGAGSGDSDALDFITAPGFEQHCAQAFFDWLAKDKTWDVCSLELLRQQSQAAACLSGIAQASGWRVVSAKTPNFIVDLPKTWDEYLSMLQSGFRPLLTRYPKRLASRYRVEIVRCQDAGELDAQLQTLFALHQMRWTGLGESGAFASAERRIFYGLMARALLDRGWLEFWRLVLNGETVAAQFCFRYHQNVYLLQEGFDPKYAAEKIGYALRAHVLQEMIRTGATCYDFLGGADSYKQKFGARQASYIDLHMAGPSWRGRAFLALRDQKTRTKLWLKDKLPARLLARLQQQKNLPANSKLSQE